MHLNWISALLISLQAGQSAGIPMELPRLPTYLSATVIGCGQNNFSIEIKNAGFTTELVSSRRNGQTVIFRSVAGEDMAEILRHMHSVSIQPSNCRPGDVIDLAIRGVDMRAKSETYGKEVILFCRQ